MTPETLCKYLLFEYCQDLVGEARTSHVEPCGMDAASPKLGGHEFCSYLHVSQVESFPTVYGMPMLGNIGMSYTVGKLRVSALQ